MCTPLLRSILRTLGFVVLVISPLHAAAPVSYDVVVYSGNPCGFAAATAAARSGAKVLLIEPTQHVGGLNTSGINTAESEHMLLWTIGGLAGEFYRQLGAHYGTGKPEYYFESSVAEKVMLSMLQAAKTELHFGAGLVRVEKEGASIRRLILTDGLVVHAKQFIDASYEGDLMAQAGVTFAVGREARSDFNEEAAGIRFDLTPQTGSTVDEQGHLLPGISGWTKDYQPGAADPTVMNYNFRLTVTNEPSLRVPFPEPAHYDRGQYRLLQNWLEGKTSRQEAVKLTDILDFYARRNHKFELNNKQAAIISLGFFGAQKPWPTATADVRQAIFLAHRDYTLGLLHFLGNDESVPLAVRQEMKTWGLHSGEFRDNANFPYQLYVREGRRMRGEYVMTQSDVTTDRHKDDAIGISSHHIDGHHVQRLAVSENQFVNEGRIWRRGYAYQIPYRALLPKAAECDNLLVPGAASFTHVAFCTLRLESVWMIAGHAAGDASAMVAAHGGTTRDIDIKLLQKTLRSEEQVVDFVPGQPEKNPDLRGPPEF